MKYKHKETTPRFKKGTKKKTKKTDNEVEPLKANTEDKLFMDEEKKAETPVEATDTPAEAPATETPATDAPAEPATETPA